MTRPGRSTTPIEVVETARRGGRRAAAGAILVGALLLAGCSSGDVPSGGSVTGTGTSATSAPAEAVAARSGGFTLVPAEGWVDATDRAGEVAGLDLVVLSSVQVAKFNDNLVITSAKGGATDLDAEISRGRTQLEGQGRTISDAPDLQVAGETATGFSSAFEEAGIPVVARSYGVSHGGRIYLLTLSSSPGEADHAMAELTAMLAGWLWT
ncbi:MAG: hypothetical protein ABIS35_15955 [Terracoccus sp.]